MEFGKRQDAVDTTDFVTFARAKGQHVHPTSYQEVANLLLTCYGEAMGKLV